MRSSRHRFRAWRCRCSTCRHIGREFAAQLELESVFEEYVVGAPHGVGGFHERLYYLCGAGGRVVVVRAHAALGVLELQYVAVLFAVVYDLGIFAIVLVHGVPPAFIVVVVFEVFLGFSIAVYADFAVLEVHERYSVLGFLCESGIADRGKECRRNHDVLDSCAHAFKIIFFGGF